MHGATTKIIKFLVHVNCCLSAMTPWDEDSEDKWQRV
jgi:hypothetical protein